MKNNVWIFFVLAGLFIAFAIVSLLVYFTDGKNARLLKRKLAIGASIIAITGVFNGCRPVVTCYEVAVEPVFTCTDSVDTDGNIVIKQSDTEIAFDCEFMYYETVTYRLVKSGNVEATDSCVVMFGDQMARLMVNLPEAMAIGDYDLKLYYYSLADLKDDSTPFKQFNVKIINDGE
jgi:hypothetical protein